MKDPRNLTAQPPRGKRQPPTVQIDWGRPLGRQVLDRVIRNGDANAFDKVLRMTLMRKRGGDGFHKETDGIAAAILDLLRDKDLRREFAKVIMVSPESFRSDEECARSLTIGYVFGNLARRLDAVTSQRLAKFERERGLERRLRDLSDDFDEAADWYGKKAADHLRAVEVAHGFARYLGRSLERDFGVRAPRLVAEVTNRGFKMTPEMTEHQARYLCGWKRTPSKPEQTQPLLERKP
jgi:hypothetical protein